MGVVPTMAPPSAHSTDHELSQLEALPTEILEKQLEQLPVSTLLRAMSVSRRLAAVALNILRRFFQAVVPSLQNDRVKILLVFAPPPFVNATVQCAYSGMDDCDNDITALYSRFRPVAHPSAPVLGPFLCRAALDDGETFTQFKVIVKIILKSEPGGYWIPISTTVFDGILRLSREWLSQGTAGIRWADQHQTVGLHLLPRTPINAARTGTKYYDLEVRELHIRTTRFLKGVEEEERAQGDGRLVVLRRVERNGAIE